jgi:glycosyltransferase involved in cell wall biosynthesis
MSAPGRRQRVLHLINGEFYAGAERVQDLLAMRLGDHGFDVEFACLKQGVFAEKRHSKGTTLHSMPMGSRVDVRACYRLARMVKASQFRLIHTHTPRSALLGRLVAQMANVPMVHHVHSPAESDTENGLRNARNAMAEKFSLRGARRLIAVSESLQRHLLKQGYAPDRIRAVPNGVPTSERGRLEYAPGQDLVLGMLALYRPRKGVEVLLDAMGRLRESGVGVRLHAVGPFETVEYEQSVKDQALRLGLQDAVHWAGFRSDIAAQFRRMHVFVLPSLFGEGMPMVVLEAMAAGLPIVSTRVEGIPQVVRDGQDGLLVGPDDAEGLAQALLKFATGQVSGKAMGDSGWQRQRHQFSDQSMAAGIAAVYGEVLNQ